MTKHKLYPTTNNRTNWVTPAELQTRNIMNFLSWCDGKSSLEEIAVKIKLSSKNINKIFKLLLKKKLIHI